jgi:hypothetical protein
MFLIRLWPANAIARKGAPAPIFGFDLTGAIAGRPDLTGWPRSSI